MTSKVGGRIVRIKIKGFMTYDDLEIYPNKGLNLIIGLNGSGKSSIMSAICLGLGGKPQFTGRTVQLSEFIKYNHDKAIVEIELESTHVRNDVITRVIQADKQLWYLNNKIVQQNEITSIIKKYNIDMGNLCQFLPQEKVAEFSKMDKKQRLVNMIQAIGDPKLVTLFNDLKRLRNEFCRFEKDMDELENHKATEEKMNERLKPEIEKQQDRIKLINELKLLKIKKMVCEYRILSEELKQIESERKQMEVKISKKEEKSNNLKKEKALYSSECQSYKIKVEKLKTEISGCMKKLTQYYENLGKFHEEVDNAKINFENKMLEKKEQKAKLAAISMQIEGLKDVLRQKKDVMATLKEKLVEIGNQYENVKQQLTSCHSAIDRERMSQNALEYKKISKLEEINRISNEEDKKYEILRQKYPDTYAALKWLQQNENSFRACVSPPPLVSIQVHNDEYRKFIENTVADRDLLMFVCEDNGDLERFVNIMKREKKLSVNVSMVPEKTLDNFPSRPITSEMRSLGIDCYLKDLFTAPDPVMRYLCDIKKVHQVPVCKEINDKNIDSILKYSSLFFTTSERISGTRSRYGQHSMSVKREVLVGRNVLPNIKDNSAALLSAKQELQELERMLEKCKQNYDGLENQRTQLEREQEQLRIKRNEIDTEKRKYSDLHVKLQQFAESYKRKEKEQVNEEEEKRKFTDAIQSVNFKKLEILSEMNKIIKEILHSKKEKATSVLQIKCYNEKISSLNNKISSLEEDLNNARSRHNELTLEKRRLKEEGMKLHDHIKADRDIAEKTLNEGYLEKLKEIGSPVLGGAQNYNLEETEQQISNVEAQLELTNEDINHAMAEFKKREKVILNIEEQVKSLIAKTEDLKKIIHEKKEEWLPPLRTHIESVNKKFSKYYKILKCAGEISLDQTDDEYDFPNYGLQLKLKYRVDEEFMELSQTHHSGGECSVAAIIFILSLQELTDVPFRCIDEINQGMDAINERKIYQLIADAAKSGSCSQYFLLTPKLLMDLSYHQEVSVHTIFNSPFLQAKLNVKEHLRIVKSNRQ